MPARHLRLNRIRDQRQTGSIAIQSNQSGQFYSNDIVACLHGRFLRNSDPTEDRRDATVGSHTLRFGRKAEYDAVAQYIGCE